MNEFKFKKNVDIGSLDAENDKFLFDAFTDRGDYSVLSDVKSDKSIILGRTGTGKSALIRYLEENNDGVKRINPETLSLSYLSSSDILDYFTNLNINLSLFYKVLWQHVFIVEILKLEFGDNVEKTKNFFSNLINSVSNPQKKAAIQYLNQWKDKFWKDTEHRILEIEKKLEKDFVAELKDKTELYKDIKTVSPDIIRFLNSKAQKVVSSLHIRELSEIVKIIKNELFANSQKKYYIVIDDLDKEWIDRKIVYDVLKGLIDVINEFRKIPGVKIIIALRTNIHKKIFKQNKDRGVQREKYNHLYLRLEWTKTELKELLNNRLRELMRGKYEKTAPKAEDILHRATKTYSSGLEYIIERTLMRPRDVIDFFNKAIRYADGKTTIKRDILLNAEYEYSQERINALQDEWRENFGELKKIYGFMVRSNVAFNLTEIEEKVEAYVIDNFPEYQRNNYLREFVEPYEQEEKFDGLFKNILVILYEVGLLGIKESADERMRYSYEISRNLDYLDIDKEYKFYIHPAFHKALKIKYR